MSHPKYKLTFLPLFEEDLKKITDYISTQLKNPDAALKFIDEVEKAINKRLENPFAFAPYQSSRNRPYPYFRIIE